MNPPDARFDPRARDQELATDYRTPPHILDQVARKPVVHWRDGQRTVDTGARLGVADHPEVSPDTLSWLLSVSVDEAVIANALRHESAPLDALHRYVHSANPEHWNALAENSGVGDAFLEEVVRAHPDRPQVALCALLNPATGDQLFDRIAEGLGSDWARVVSGIRKARADRW